MIVSLEGLVESVDSGSVVINVSGIGFGVFVDSWTESELRPGVRTKLLVSSVFSEKGIELYGFLDPQRQKIFNVLIKISKIGPKTALRLLSHLKEEDLKSAIKNDDLTILQQVPGVGKKMAERLLFELKRLGDEIVSMTENAIDTKDAHLSQAVEALMALGYSKSEAAVAVKAAVEKLGKDIEVEKVVKEALRVIFSS
ncbi:MAG: Holliday junction branch migration protein RuvA [Thermotogae bacterium]|nr:Holliday junction branch migration protein RuvA [Thermotogota bacterium]